MHARTSRWKSRTVDMRVIGDWVDVQSRVLDLGCGKGELLDHLKQLKQVSAVGVDFPDLERITACVRRGVTAYQGDMTAFMRALPAGPLRPRDLLADRSAN